MMPLESVLLEGIRRTGGDPAGDWIEQAIARVSTGALDALVDAYTQASQRLGRAPLGLRPDEARQAAGGSIPTFERWTLEDAGRWLLLVGRHRAAASGDAFTADAIACFEQGDAREQTSWLRAVTLLPEPRRFLPHVIDSCRTNILPLFEAVACENPYPAAYFPELNFNQMVLKALFNGIPLSRVVGLPGRLNSELARMASDYAAERRAAGRTVPADISMVTAA
jgi:hypothetical protein